MASSTNEVILFFRDFLESNLKRVRDSVGQELLDDWLQTNWEILVESKLCTNRTEFLEIYGDGADCNERSSRVWNPNAKAMWQIGILLNYPALDEFTGSMIPVKKSADKHLIFERFVSWNGEVYAEDMRLEFLIASRDKNEYLLKVTDIEFEVVPIR